MSPLFFFKKLEQLEKVFEYLILSAGLLIYSTLKKQKFRILVKMAQQQTCRRKPGLSEDGLIISTVGFVIFHFL